MSLKTIKQFIYKTVDEVFRRTIGHRTTVVSVDESCAYIELITLPTKDGRKTPGKISFHLTAKELTNILAALKAMPAKMAANKKAK